MNTSATTRCTLFAFLLTLLWTLPLQAQEKTQQIDDLLSTYHDFGMFNGTVLVAEGGTVLFKKGYGLAQMEWDIPNTPDTKFRLGSITKQFTATLILQLAHEGKLSTDDPISRHLPDYPRPVADQVTIHHLLTHTSGIPSYTGRPDFFREQSRDPYTPDAFVETFADLPLEFEPGAEWRYNNSGYFLLGVIIEKVTGQSYEDALQERIFGPLGMAASGYDHHRTILDKRAAGYERDGLGYINAPYLDMSLPYAAGSLYATVEDLYRWDRALYTDDVLPATLKEKMFTPYMNGYGYGWAIEDRPLGETGATVKTIGHGGGINGFNTLITRVPDGEHLIVLLNNTGGTALGEMSQGILNILHGEAAERPRKPIAREMQAVIAEKGIDAAVAHYKALQANHADAFDFAEQQLNRLGYAYLGKGDIDTAITLFTLNTETYPEAYNTYDSLGEAFMVAGNTEAAIANYQKSIELNPRNQNGKDMLAKMGVEVDPDLGQEMTLDADVLERYVGTYELQPGFVITVTRDGTRLFAQATGQQQFEIFASSETQFFLKVVEAQITFHTEGDGPATSLTLHQGGRNMPAPRTE